MTTTPRRDFLWQALAVCGSTLLAPAATAGAAQATATARVRQASRGYFADRAEAVRAIGEAYLRQLGATTDSESVLAAARGALQAIERARDERRAIERLVRVVREDFERGRTVQVEGWILSRTEAELCVLTLLAP